MNDEELRKWCLEQAFETRAIRGPTHLEVTNVAAEYYAFIKHGKAQGSQSSMAELLQYAVKKDG